MLDSLLIGIVTAGVTRSEALDWIPYFFWRGGSLADAAEIKQWCLIPLCCLRDAMQKGETPWVCHVRVNSAWVEFIKGSSSLPFSPGAVGSWALEGSAEVEG